MNKKVLSKTINPTKRKKARQKPRGLFTSSSDLMSWRTAKPTKEWIQEFADLLLEWAQQEDALDLIDFYSYHGIPEGTFYDWIDKYESLKVAHKMTMRMLGARKQRLATFKKYGTNENVITRTLFQYHPDWKVSHEEEKAMRSKEASKLTSLTIEMPNFKDSDDLGHTDKDKT